MDVLNLIRNKPPPPFLQKVIEPHPNFQKSYLPVGNGGSHYASTTNLFKKCLNDYLFLDIYHRL